jgi:hypothetical protein
MPPSVEVATHGCFAMCSMSHSAIEKPRIRAPPLRSSPSIWMRMVASTGSSCQPAAMSFSVFP